MADYYTLLAKAVASFPKDGPAAPRKAIYDRARSALLRQLHALGPALSAADIAREEASLETAITRVEAQFTPAPAPARTPLSPRTPPAARAPLAPAAQPAATAKPGAPPLPGAPARPAAPRPTAPAVGAAAKPPIGVEASARSSPDARPAPAAGRSSPPPPPLPHREVAEPSSAPPIVAASDDASDAEDHAPPVDAATSVDRVAYAPAATNHESIRPSAPSDVDAPRANPLPWIVLAVLVGVVLSVAVAAFLLRQKPQDLAIQEPVAAADSQPATSAAKIAERVGGGAPATPAPASSPGATPASEASAAATAPQPAASPGLPVSARAAMLVAVASDQQKPPAVSLGSVVWTSIPAMPGQPATLAVKAEADIPDLKMHAVMTMRKNIDPNLPASHTIDLRVTFGDGAEIKGVKDMRVPMMRRDDPPAQDSLAGVRVKISDSYFLVGLNRADADAARNADLIASRGWFDFPLLLNDDRIAKLTFEKGADGERVLTDALAAWKAP
jgi:hypothetical protein